MLVYQRVKSLELLWCFFFSRSAVLIFFCFLRVGGTGILCPIQFFRGCKSSSWKFEFPGAPMKEDKKNTD